MQSEQFWIYALFIGYPAIALLFFPVTYWVIRQQQTNLDNVNAYLWGWPAALVDALVTAVFWPIWIVMFIGGFVVSLVALALRQ